MDLRINSTPGKFEGELIISEFIYELTLDGADKDFNSVDGSWYALLVGDLHPNPSVREKYNMTEDEVIFLGKSAGAIVAERDNGFVYVTYYDYAEELQRDWNSIRSKLEDTTEY